MADDTPPSETPAQRRLTTDPERIREWAEARDAVPIRVRDGEGHGHSFARRDEMGEHHEEVTWDEFVERFEDDDLVFAYHEEEPTGEGMGFFELVERDRAFERADLGRDELEDSLRRGETVTTEIVETQVVETEVVERDTIESEVIDTELVEREVVDSERLSRDIVDTEFVADDTIEVAVDETRLDTIEEIERYIVESRIVDIDIEQDQEMERDVVETDIELESVQRSILESDVLRSSVTADDVLEREVIQSQRTEGDAVRSELIERRTLEEELDERLEMRYVLEESELVESDVVRSEMLEGEIIDVEEYGSMVTGETAEIAGDETMADAGSDATGIDGEEATATGGTAPTVELSQDEQGKDVIDESGQQIGMVAEVEGQTAYVDPEPGLTDRLKARMDWGGHGDDDYPVDAAQITEITADEVVIRSE
ncbi:hypothetical protein [Natrinema altunense]|uniref:DUF2382 domain-containing protein n=1 Tax=Natrinema altunense (strain JCM 12890 / CGMCC 1.3731 / AJ2) TaxID=1227494 RepID=L9ZX90_NATA2|nr:hypothetical protein [Natrinema altunense]ELY89773.1 hypothetical protein C485_04725 [Natrinema altunense JCM 12890]